MAPFRILMVLEDSCWALWMKFKSRGQTFLKPLLKTSFSTNALFETNELQSRGNRLFAPGGYKLLPYFQISEKAQRLVHTAGTQTSFCYQWPSVRTIGRL